MDRKLIGTLCVLAALSLSCQPASLRPLAWGQMPAYNQVAAPDLLEHSPVGVLAGDTVPFDGFVVPRDEWRVLIAEYGRLQEAISLSQQGRGGDRATCDEYVSNLQGEVVRLKEDRPRICALCAATGSAAGATLAGAAVAQGCD